MPNYFLHRDGQNHGPYSLDQLQQSIAQGQIAPQEWVCQEGSEEWVPASSLVSAAPARAVPVVARAIAQPAAAGGPAITEAQVANAYQKVKTAFYGVLFSVALPCILLAAKSDAERGVRSSGRYRGLQNLAKENTDFLPIAVVLGAIGLVVCSIWLAKALKRARALKAEFQKK